MKIIDKRILDLNAVLRQYMLASLREILNLYLIWDLTNLILDYVAHSHPCGCKHVFCHNSMTKDLTVIRTTNSSGILTLYFNNINIYANFYWALSYSKSENITLRELYQNLVVFDSTNPQTIVVEDNNKFWNTYLRSLGANIEEESEVVLVEKYKHMHIDVHYVRKFIIEQISEILKVYLVPELIKIILGYMFCSQEKCKHKTLFCKLSFDRYIKLLFCADLYVKNLYPPYHTMQNKSTLVYYHTEFYRLYLDLQYLRLVCRDRNYPITQTIFYGKIMNSFGEILNRILKPQQKLVFQIHHIEEWI